MTTVHPPFKQHLGPGEGVAFNVEADQYVRITDIRGQQVSNLVCYATADSTEHLELSFSYSQSRTGSEALELYSDRGNRMFTAVADTVGVHDLRGDLCTDGEFRRRFDIDDATSCHTALIDALGDNSVPEWLPFPLSVFKSVHETPDTYRIQSAASKPGDYLTLRADMDLLVAIATCAHRWDPRNNFVPTPIEVVIMDTHGAIDDE